LKDLLKRRSQRLLLFAFIDGGLRGDDGSGRLPALTFASGLDRLRLISWGIVMGMTRLAVSIFVLSAVIGFGVASQAADEKPQEFVVCKSSKSVRTLSITRDTPSATAKTGASSCKVTYTKLGVPEMVGEHTASASCHSILDHVKARLENSKWNCKQVSATMTTSAEISRQ
jgi:hypothetical protein